jgi:hypothetical protein
MIKPAAQKFARMRTSTRAHQLAVKVEEVFDLYSQMFRRHLAQDVRRVQDLSETLFIQFNFNPKVLVGPPERQIEWQICKYFGLKVNTYKNMLLRSNTRLEAK